MWLYAVFIIISYFLGAIPFSLLIAKLKGVDLLKTGSGNLGATNVYRSLGIKWAFLVFTLDALKGGVPTYFSIFLLPDKPLMHVIIAACTIIGHSLSCFVKFKGGKGAATGLGVLLALSPKIFMLVAGLAFIIIGLTRYVSIGSIICSLIIPWLFYFFRYPAEYVFFIGFICFFIVFRHKKNIKRLLTGTENKI